MEIVDRELKPCPTLMFETDCEESTNQTGAQRNVQAILSCLNPRSAYFYEFPPTERSGKKKTTFTRFLKHLKAHRKEKSGSPKHPMHRKYSFSRSAWRG
ncbi:unnamed protein product [Bemisia tabaci]|uniref:Uncharacterized protein n=1 Tax=Bemisia tabaci TaxID=7038 RepID=A0A9N9ZY07_BEMTA|nr:unnamed protein product [Bemisia tabaci]